MNNVLPQVLTIAGSDSGAGAGIQADLKTFQANGVYGLSVIASVTAQNTQAVTAAFDLPLEIIEAQLEAVFGDFTIAAAKTGMLSSAAIVSAVAAKLREVKVPQLVVDPVMVSKSGFRLLQPSAIVTVINELLPLATLITPNIPEAELLTDLSINGLEQAQVAARKLYDRTGSAVLVKGGHLADAPIDVLFDGRDFTLFEGERIVTKNTHGTGCTYAAAIAAHLALGAALPEAIARSKHYVTEAIRHSLAIGHGHGPTDHFYFLRSPAEPE